MSQKFSKKKKPFHLGSMEGVAATLYVLSLVFSEGNDGDEIPFKLPNTILYHEKGWIDENTFKKLEGPKSMLDAVVKLSKVCLVWYSDGTCEQVPSSNLFEIFSSPEWENQILCIQDYLNPEKVEEQFFTFKNVEMECLMSDGILLYVNKLSFKEEEREEEVIEEVIEERVHQQAVEDQAAIDEQRTPKQYCTTSKYLVDFLIVQDLLQELDKVALEELATECGQNGLRVTLVPLKDNLESNVNLSKWLFDLIEQHYSNKPLFLAGIGIGANVVFHLAAFRKCLNLKGILSINGFSFMDRTMIRYFNSSPELPIKKTGFIDLRPALGLIKIPMVVVQATEDSVVFPLHVEAIVNARDAPRTISSSLGDCINSQTLKSHVIWLKGSHDIIKDRIEFFKGLVFRIYGHLKGKDTSIELVEEEEEEKQLVQASLALEENQVEKRTSFEIQSAIDVKSSETSWEEEISSEEEEQEEELFFSPKTFPTVEQEKNNMMDSDIESHEYRRIWNRQNEWEMQQQLVGKRLRELQRARMREEEMKQARQTYLDTIRMNLQAEEQRIIDEDNEILSQYPSSLSTSMSGAAKLRLDFLKVSQRQATNIERSKHCLQGLNEIQASKDMKAKRLAELERAVNQLKIAAKIANPNQASRKKKRQAEEAAVELVDVIIARDETQVLVASLQEKLRDVRNQLSKINNAIQTDSIIQKRKLGELEEMTNSLKLVKDEMEKEIESVHIERNTILNRQKDVAKLFDLVKSRCVDVDKELQRCRKIHTNYIDSSIWQSGVLQRLRRDDLIKYLKYEKKNLGERKELLDEETEKQETELNTAINRIVFLQSEIASVSSQHSLVSSALGMHESGGIRQRAQEHFQLGGVERISEDPVENDLAYMIRRKPSMKRTQEEKEWIAIDMVLNRELYTSSMITTYKAYNELPETDIESIFDLPDQINLALPFLKSQTHLRAYHLIQKYSLGNDPRDVAMRDNAAARSRISFHKYQVKTSLEAYRLELDESRKIPTPEEQQNILIVNPKWERLYNVTEQVLESRHGRVHTFHLPETFKFVQLVAHILYEGCFDERGYRVGRLSGGVYLNETIPIGYCSSDVTVCTAKTMGKFSLVHAPNDDGLPLTSGKYQIVIGAASYSRYSISIMGQTARPYPETIKTLQAEALALQERLENIDKEIENFDESCYLSERKIGLVQNLFSEAQEKCKELEIEMAVAAQVLNRIREREFQGDEYESPEDEGDESSYSPERSASLEQEFNKYVRLAASRKMELLDTRKGTEQMIQFQQKMAEEKISISNRIRTLQTLNVISSDFFENAHKEKMKQAQQIVEQERFARDQILKRALEKQTNLEPCWNAIQDVLNFKPTADGLTRQELLAIACSDKNEFNQPSVLALHDLLRCRFPCKKVFEDPPPPRAPSVRENRLNCDVQLPKVIQDIDLRSRLVWRNLSLANKCKDAFMNSHVLHGTEQRFPIQVLRKELNRELDRLLVLQVREQELMMLKEMQLSKTRQHVIEDMSSESESEPDELLVSEKTNLYGYCKACNTKPCCWKPTGDQDAMQARLRVLQNELDVLKSIHDSVRFIESTVPKSSQRGGKTKFLRADLFRELSKEVIMLSRKLRLIIIDEELHAAYACNEAFIETQALHGYKQVQWTHNVITALEVELQRTVLLDVVGDLVVNVLDYMLEGWVFGERESNIAVIEEAHEKEVIRLEPAQKWTLIADQMEGRKRRKKAVELKEDVSHTLNETENALQFGMFMMTLMYFRAMTLLKKSKFQGETKSRRKTIPAAERQRMDRSERRVLARKRLMDAANEKASSGSQRRSKILEDKKQAQQSKLRVSIVKQKAEKHAAVEIQRVFRGLLGRYAGRKWAIRSLQKVAHDNLRYAAAVAIQRIFRAYRARLVALDKRTELAEFIAQVRAEEAKEEEEEYWRNHPVKRAIKNAKKVLFKPKLRKLESNEESFYTPPTF